MPAFARQATDPARGGLGEPRQVKSLSIERTLWLSIAMLLGLAMAAQPTRAATFIDGSTLAVAHGQSDTTIYRLGVRKDWASQWQAPGGLQTRGYWEARLGYWDGERRRGSHNSLWELSLTPVLRLAPSSTREGGVSPYLEGGVGLHLLSHTSIANRQFSTAFQFGSLIGTGLRFGTRGRYQLGYRFQHISNASIKTPNSGMNLHEISFSVAY